MHQNDRAGVQFQRAFYHFAGVNGDMVDRAFGLFLIRHQHILAVKEKDAELFGFAMRHGGVAVIDQRIPAAEQGLVDHPGAHEALGGGLDDLEFLDDGIPDAFDHAEARGGGRNDAVEITEGVQEEPCERFHILSGDGAKENQFEELVIRHGCGAALNEAGAEAFAVIGDIAGEFGGQEGRCGFVLIPIGEEQGERCV